MSSHAQGTGNVWRKLAAASLSLLLSRSVVAQPAMLSYDDCFSGSNTTQKLSVSTVYAQLIGTDYLNLTVIGQSNIPIIGRANSSSNLATLFTTMSTLTFDAWTNSTYFCSAIRPPSPLPSTNNSMDMYCPIAAGPFAFSTSIPWSSNHELTTQNTQLHAVDPYGNDLLCLNVQTTPLNHRLGSPYGSASIIFWSTVALAIAYWLVVGITRLVSAWGRGSNRPGPGFWPKIESAGFILASAISGERLATSPALMRFCSPSMRDIVFHSQWCAAVAMVAVEWPGFAYPILAQTAWATLSYNISLTQGENSHYEHWNPLGTELYNPPSNFADQLNDPNSVLYINPNRPNTLFTLPETATDGISSFAATVGLRPQDLFGTCLGLFLAIIAGTVVLSLIVWLIDWVALLMTGGSSNTIQGPRLGGMRTPPFATTSKDGLDGIPATDESRSLSGQLLMRATSRLPTARRGWWKSRPDFGSFHGSTLVGNLVRILVLFHFPVTIFSCYQFTIGRASASLASVILAAFSFAVISVLIPVLLVIRLTTTSTNKLYDETRTLLTLGPLYNHYRHGSQLFACLLFATNIAFGVTIGCGQKSGTAQAIIILIIEVVSALVTSIWLPWGQGASMGLISFLFCVARIVIAVLLVILTPTISIGSGAGGWVAYGILFVLALVYLAFVLMLVVKLMEGLVRIFGHVGFDKSKSSADSGLLGAIGMCGGRKSRSQRSRRRYRATAVPRDAVSEVSSYLPPAGMQKEATPSHHSQPASVLRPEQALRPYREDSDDEEGFIMGAWQPFPRPGYNAVEEHQSPTQAHVNVSSTSGFSRVGGGRATFDTPYAIASGSTSTFPSGRTPSMAANSAQLPPTFHDDDDEPLPTASVANIARQPQQTQTDLPRGAMSPHNRTKSQTAIVEDFNPTSLYLSPPTADKSRRASSSGIADEDADGSQPKKKHWYQIRKNRRHSEGADALARDDGEGEPEPDEPAATTPTPGKSFVVIRDKRPQSSSPRPATGNTDASGSTDRATTPTSFRVLRGKDTGEGRASS